MHRREQAQQVNPKELGGGVFPMPPAPVRPCGQHSLMKSSGMNGFKSSSSAVVPVAGRSEFMPASLSRES
jgi:hypothetical protein